ACDGEVVVGKCCEIVLGRRLRARVRGERSDGRLLAAQSFFGKSVHAAARRKDEPARPGLSRAPCQLYRRAVVDGVGDLLEGLADRIVRDRGEMDDACDSLERRLWRLPNITEVLAVEQ